MSFLDLFDFASAEPPEPDARAVGGTDEENLPPRRAVPSGMNPEFEAKMQRFIDAAAAAGIEIKRGGGFRTREQQAALYAQKPNLAAPPGHSQHELGLAYDLTYGKGASEYAHEHAGEYGLRFPMSYEPWHIQQISGNAPRARTVQSVAASTVPVAATPLGEIGMPLPPMLSPRVPDINSSESQASYQQPIEGAQDEALAQMLESLRSNSAQVPDSVSPVPSALPPEQSFLQKAQAALGTGIDLAGQFGQEFAEQVRQGTTGVIESAVGAPWGLGAAVTAGPALAARKMGWEGPAKAVDFMRQEQGAASDLARTLTGAEAPKGPGQKAMRTIGQSYVPGVPSASAVQAGVQLGMAALPEVVPGVRAQAPMDKGVAEQIMFPNAIPNMQLPGPRVTHTTIMTLGGPAKVSDGELLTLGIMGVASLGAMFGPMVIQKIRGTPLPVYRPVKEAASGTVAISNRVDLARTYDDVNAGVLRLARRAGMDSTALARVSDTMQIQAGGAARNMVNSAISTGRMETPTFAFKSKVPVATLAKMDNPQTAQYLHTLNTFDDILWIEGKRKPTPGIPAGTITVRGMTKQDALAQVNAMEQADPKLRDYGKAYFDNVKQMRAFNSKGEYATISPQELQALNQTSQHYVPWKTSSGERTRVFDNSAAVRVPPTEALRDAMQHSMRERMENEAKGLYIDEMRRVNPGFFVQVEPSDLTKNANWKKNTVEMYRRGKIEHYTTDPFIADVMRLDPYSITGVLPMAMYSGKRAVEMTATGLAAPFFSITSAIRSWQIAKLTTPEGRTTPSAVGQIAAVPRQLLPQVARAMQERLDAGSGGWLSSVLGQTTMQALSTKLGQAYSDSLYAQMESAGTHRGSFLQHQAEWSSTLNNVIERSTGPARTFFEGYKSVLDSIHNSASFDYVYKNQNLAISKAKLAMEGRHLTGDPTVGGRAMQTWGRPIRMEYPNEGMVSKGLTNGVQLYGTASEFGREAVPWFNITEQGIKRIGESYLDNPIKFVGKLWLYQMGPTAAIWFWNRANGTDPNGINYSDYQMNGRSEYAKQMQTYIAIPGRSASDGMEFPRVHEFTPAVRLMEVALDHLARTQTYQGAEDYMRTALSLVGAKDAFPQSEKSGGAIWSQGEDLKGIASQFWNVALEPPTPPIFSAWDAAHGRVTPQGMFSGESYTKKVDPYDQLGGMNTTMELLARSLGTGTADIIGSGYAAYTQTPEGFLKGLKNASTEAGKRTITKTPILRDLTNIHLPASGNVRVTQDLFDKQRSVDQLARFFRKWDKVGGQGGNINVSARSPTGGAAVDAMLGPGPGHFSPGLDQPEPTNPLYLQFMTELYTKMKKDALTRTVDPVTGKSSRKKGAVEEDTGAIGIPSAWARYGDYTEKLKRMRSINDGNYVTWQLQLSQRPEELKYLKDNNVDYKSPRAVQNWYQQKRLDAARLILFSIRAVEEDFSQRIGKPIKIEDLDPYGKNIKNDTEMLLDQDIPPWGSVTP
jgi:hypothetical protein